MFNELKEYAKENKVPIIFDDGLSFLRELILKYHVKDILEIGTAIGYSALCMAQLGTYVDTIERDPKCVEIARNFLGKYDQEKRITLIEADALTYDISENRKYDMIFIDAAKSQYEAFFNRYTPYLKEGGIVVCDNIDFHDLKEEQVSRKTRALLKKIHKFKLFLESNDAYQTTFFHRGDGISVSIKKR